MKKILITIILLGLFFNVNIVNANNNLIQNAKSGLLMEVSTGTVIYEKNMNERIAIASMTKMMGMLLVMEALDNGQIKLNDTVIVSKNASGMGGSQIWLEEGEKITILDLIKGIMMASANDAVVAIRKSNY